MISFVFALTSALTFGQLDTIVSVLEFMTRTFWTLGPFDLSPALGASVFLVMLSGGLNLFNFGANSKENSYATTGLSALFLLMAIPDFSTWASQGFIGAILFVGSLAAYSVIGGIGISSEKDESLVSNATSKITGGYL